MTTASKVVSWTRNRGEPLSYGYIQVTPESRSLTLRLPFILFSWSTPAAVYVADGQIEQRIRVLDLTRLSQLTLFGSGVALALVILILGNKR